ncbi:ankyrin-2-like [Argonauta hians]
MAHKGDGGGGGGGGGGGNVNDKEKAEENRERRKMGKLSAEEEELQRRSVQRLLAEAITYDAPLKDIETILKFGGDVNGNVNRGLKPIHYASYANNTDIIRLLLKYGADINARDDVGYTPLHLCARKGHLKSMKYLIKSGAKINIESSEYTPKKNKIVLNDEEEGENENESQNQNQDQDQTENQDPNQEQNQSESGASNNETPPATVHDASGQTPQTVLEDLTIEPINLALENNHVEIVKLLLQNGARANRRYFMGFEINLVPLGNIECLDLLLQYGADPNSINRCGVTPLMKAAKENEILAIRLLLKYGANVNLQCPERFEQKTALHLAIEAGNRTIARTLLLHKASPSKFPNYKYNALHTAVLTDRADLVELVLLFPLDVNEVTDDDCTALMMACAASNSLNQREIINLLLQAGADPNKHAGIINYIAPCFSPIVEYLRNQDSLSYDIILNLIQHGATVHFGGFTTVVRKRNPFGILHYFEKVSENEKLLKLLMESCSLFDVYAIERCKDLSSEDKEFFENLGKRPLPLKNLIRLFMRNLLMPNVLEKVPKLPLPEFLKKYLSFEAI